MKKLILGFILFCSLTSYAQQDPLFTQYMFNKLVVNPAYAGSREDFNIDLLNRIQWVGIGGAPETFTLSANTAMRNKHVGLGIYFYRDALGLQIDQGVMATYAYRIYFAKSSLAFGLQFGFDYFDLDWDAYHTQYPDPAFDPQDIKRVTPDANFGIYWQSNRVYAGVSSKQLLQNKSGVNTDASGNSTYSKLKRHFYLMGGFALPLDEKIIFRPSMMVKYTHNAPVQVDLNASVLFADVFWIGASFRTGNAVTFLTEFRITPRFKVGYSYDIYTNELLNYNNGSHEIRLGFEFPLYESRMRTPRYF
jgi:type IX secretion system PorP/SprF family membrane protein